jgi:hypothetical protein
MSNKDEFELDVEDTAEKSFDDVNLDEEIESGSEAAPKKKKSGGGLLIAVLLLAVLGGGGFAAVKFLGVQLPFDVPGLTQTAQAPAPTQQAADTTMTASADLPTGELPPQPAAPTDEMTADAGNLPLGIPEVATPDDGAAVNAPWGAEETPADAAHDMKQPPVETFDGSAPATQADSGNVVDPFAMQDVTEAVNAPDVAPVVAAPEQADVVDPFAALANTAAETAAAPASEAAVAAVAAPAESAAAQARVKELEAKLSTTEKSLAAAENALKKANEELAQKAVALTQAQADLKAAQTAAKSDKTAATKPAEAAPATTTEKPVAAKRAAPARKIDWVLRSAKPGMAWVSEKGSTEMRTVSVGDTLAGIGKVTAIATDAQGRWVVNGTRGSINQ